MIALENSHQNMSDYNQSLSEIFFEVNKKQIFLGMKKWEIKIILYMVMFTRSSERIFNPMRYTG